VDRQPLAGRRLYGDAALAKVPLSELPTEPKALAALLLAAHEDGRWTLNGGWNPVHDQVRRAPGRPHAPHDRQRDTSELLEWSEPGESHTFLKAGHVARVGERP
jgi:hypothetical protein